MKHIFIQYGNIHITIKLINLILNNKLNALEIPSMIHD